jgi:hypothetical protein
VVVLLILVLSCLIFRGLGFGGISAFAAWQACARDGLSLMLAFTGISHFTFMKEDFVRMMRPRFHGRAGWCISQASAKSREPSDSSFPSSAVPRPTL